MAKSWAEEKNGKRREIDTPMDGRYPVRRFTERHGDGVRVYEYAQDDNGVRVYRHVSTEAL